MATKLEKLFFAIGVQDQASGKVAKLQANITGMAKRAQASFKGIGTAAMGLVGAGLSIKALAGPAIELNRALAEVEQYGGDPKGMRVLQDAAGRFAMRYGESATDVIKSSAIIQQAVDGLSARELAAFATAGGVLAKATNAQLDATAGYMGDMYQIFESEARRMGKIRWAEQMAGQTHAVGKAFKVSAADIAAGFKVVGNGASSMGVAIGEQMAVLAAANKGMDAAAAGKSYKALLTNAVNARKLLGVSFTDHSGQLRSTADILDDIRVKYGDTLTLAQQQAFSKALGDKGAGTFINTLLANREKLGQTIKDVQGVSDLSGARTSARQSTDAFRRFGASVEYVRANFMQKLLPTLERWTNKASDHLDTVNKWITKYPNVTRVVGYCVLAVMSLAGLVALATLGFHLFALVCMPVAGAVNGVTKVLNLLSGAIRANPIGFLIWLLVLCVVYWDTVTAGIRSAWDIMRAFFASVGPLGQPFLILMDALEERWKAVTDLFSDFTWTKLLKLVISAALLPLEVFLNTLGNILDYIPGMGDEAKALKNWKASSLADDLLGPDPAKNAAALVPDDGPAGDILAVESMARQPANLIGPAVPGPVLDAAHIAPGPPSRPEVASLARSREVRVNEGGLLNSSSHRTTNNGNTVNIAEQHIHVENAPMSQDDIAALQFG